MITNVTDREIAQADTIEALRQEITAWSITAENLAAERDALAADAARLDWLSDQAEAHSWRMAGPYATLREAVDAAMKGKS